jgi:hypothetical protein
MKLIHLASIGSMIAVSSLAQEGTSSSNELSSAQIQTVQYWAKVYHIDRTKALDNYKMLLNSDYETALKGAEFFKENQALELAAASLADLTNRSVKSYLLAGLVEIQKVSPSICEALLAELDRLNQSRSDDDEIRAGLEMMKSRIATALARSLELPDPQIPLAPFSSSPLYAAFSARARAKIAVMAPTSASVKQKPVTPTPTATAESSRSDSLQAAGAPREPKEVAISKLRAEPCNMVQQGKFLFWLIPALVLVGCGAVIARFLRRRRR